MLARAEAKARAMEAEVTRKLEEQKAAALSSWRRPGPPAKEPEKKEPWRPSECSLLYTS